MQTLSVAAVEGSWWRLGEAQRGRIRQRQRGPEHLGNFEGVRGGEDSHVGNRQAQRQVEHAVVRGAVVTGDPGAVKDEEHRKVQ